MKVVPMKAEPRTAKGRNQLVRLRREGWMPAVVYGEGGEAVSIAISEWELDQHVKAHHKVFALEIGSTKETALLQEVAWHTLNDRPLHADFLRIDLSKPIEAQVEVSTIGHPVGLSKGGMLMKDHLMVEVRCLPTAMPDGIELDVSKLDVGDSVQAGALPLPEGVELVSPADMTICHVVGARASATAEGEGEGEGEGEPADGGEAK
ncbi:MAG: 50S ribosomal protein L25 [Planctomycetes bacterium]|nr:50S ribosomal protein L25 [Planctomycetota bacterium]